MRCLRRALFAYALGMVLAPTILRADPAAELLARFCKRLPAATAALYPQSVGVREGYTLAQHTTMALRQFDKYLAGFRLPFALTDDQLKTILLVHDIGKPLAVQAGDKNRQHEFTVPVVEGLERQGILGFPRATFLLAVALIDGDPIGSYLAGRIKTAEAVHEIQEMAKRAQVPVDAFFRLLTIYYQADASSYTVDAGGKYGLDFLFAASGGHLVRDLTLSRMRFAPETERDFAKLAAALN
jgi:hypothetical protein